MEVEVHLVGALEEGSGVEEEGPEEEEVSEDEGEEDFRGILVSAALRMLFNCLLIHDCKFLFSFSSLEVLCKCSGPLAVLLELNGCLIPPFA